VTDNDAFDQERQGIVAQHSVSGVQAPHSPALTFRLPRSRESIKLNKGTRVYCSGGQRR